MQRLISETVKTKWNPNTKKYYEELGYTYTKMGEEFEIKVKDLLPNSEVEIKCICDNCGKELFPEYKDYRKSKKKYLIWLLIKMIPIKNL